MKLLPWFMVVLLFACQWCWAEVELVYAEDEFPLSFVSHVRQYRFNPLSRFQTQVEGRLMELTCDPLVDIYQATAGRQAYRFCLATWNTIKLNERQVLNFNLRGGRWRDNSPIDFLDVWFSLEYRKLNALSWGGSQNLIISKKGADSFDAYLSDTPAKPPKPGEFYFPLVNRKVFQNFSSPSNAQVDKSKQRNIGYGRYYMTDIEENRHIRMERRQNHPYYKNLKIPPGYERIDKIRMHAFPRARIARNEQFIDGRVHIITSATQADVGYITNAYPRAKVNRYSDDSYSGFVFNCRHPYLQPSAVRRALNYIFRKKLALKRALGDEGEIISGPLPRRNFFYNVSVPVYDDDIDSAFAILYLYRYWGLDIYTENGKILLFADPVKGAAQVLKAGDQILEIEKKRVTSLMDLETQLKAQQSRFRIKIVRGRRILVKRLLPQGMPQLGLWSSVVIKGRKLSNFPALNLIANNPEGKNPLVKEICGALKEDLEKIGVVIKIDYLDGQTYYPRLQKGKFDLAFRTLKLTGTPNLYRLYYKGQDDTNNVNYGNYENSTINEMAWSAKDVTDVSIWESTWKRAHRILHHDPPHIFLWSRRHIIIYNPKIEVLTPGPEYKVPYGFTQINGLINIFNEVHLWTLNNNSE